MCFQKREGGSLEGDNNGRRNVRGETEEEESFQRIEEREREREEHKNKYGCVARERGGKRIS